MYNDDDADRVHLADRGTATTPPTLTEPLCAREVDAPLTVRPHARVPVSQVYPEPPHAAFATDPLDRVTTGDVSPAVPLDATEHVPMYNDDDADSVHLVDIGTATTPPALTRIIRMKSLALSFILSITNTKSRKISNVNNFAKTRAELVIKQDTTRHGELGPRFASKTKNGPPPDGDTNLPALLNTATPPVLTRIIQMKSLALSFILSSILFFYSILTILSITNTRSQAKTRAELVMVQPTKRHREPRSRSIPKADHLNEAEDGLPPVDVPNSTPHTHATPMSGSKPRPLSLRPTVNSPMQMLSTWMGPGPILSPELMSTPRSTASST